MGVTPAKGMARAGDTASPADHSGTGGEPGRRPWWHEALAPPVLAWQFLTAVPLPLTVAAESRHLGRSVGFFPVVGAILGLALAGLDGLLRAVLPASVATVLLLVAATLLTGGLHLDGLMDTCDGVFGGRTAARRLEIMRDSRVGSFGALAGALQLLLKFATLTALPAGARAPVLVAVLIAARWAMAVAMWGFPSARLEGLGTAYKARVSLPIVGVATALALAGMWLALGLLGLPLLLLAAAATLAIGSFISRRLRGLTGDSYGALGDIVESTLLVSLVAWFGRPPGA